MKKAKARQLYAAIDADGDIYLGIMHEDISIVRAGVSARESYQRESGQPRLRIARVEIREIKPKRKRK